MNNKSITPNPQQPVDRVPTGQLPSALAELSEAALQQTIALPSSLERSLSGGFCVRDICSYDGDDE